MGAYFTEKLLEMKDKYELIGDVRGPGLMLGIELVYNKKTKEPARKEAYQFEKEGIKRGVLFGNSKYAGMGNVVKSTVMRRPTHWLHIWDVGDSEEALALLPAAALHIARRRRGCPGWTVARAAWNDAGSAR